MNRPAQDRLQVILLFLATIQVCLWRTAQALPASAATVPESALFRYQTNFLDVLRLKSRLARSSTRNVAAAIAMANSVNDDASPLDTFTSVPLEKPATVSDDSDAIEVEESGPGMSVPFNRQCGIPSRNSAIRQGRIVGGEVVNHGQFPWMVSVRSCLSFENWFCFSLALYFKYFLLYLPSMDRWYKCNSRSALLEATAEAVTDLNFLLK